MPDHSEIGELIERLIELKWTQASLEQQNARDTQSYKTNQQQIQLTKDRIVEIVGER